MIDRGLPPAVVFIGTRDAPQRFGSLASFLSALIRRYFFHLQPFDGSELVSVALLGRTVSTDGIPNEVSSRHENMRI